MVRRASRTAASPARLRCGDRRRSPAPSRPGGVVAGAGLLRRAVQQDGRLGRNRRTSPTAHDARELQELVNRLPGWGCPAGLRQSTRLAARSSCRPGADHLRRRSSRWDLDAFVGTDELQSLRVERQLVVGNQPVGGPRRAYLGLLLLAHGVHVRGASVRSSGRPRTASAATGLPTRLVALEDRWNAEPGVSVRSVKRRPLRRASRSWSGTSIEPARSRGREAR